MVVLKRLVIGLVFFFFSIQDSVYVCALRVYLINRFHCTGTGWMNMFVVRLAQSAGVKVVLTSSSRMGPPRPCSRACAGFVERSTNQDISASRMITSW